MRIKGWWLASSVVLLMALLTFVGNAFLQYWYAPAKSDRVVLVETGTPSAVLMKRLRQPSSSLQALALKLGLRWWNASIRAGEYRLEQGTNPVSWLRLMQEGKVVQHDFTVVPGTTWDEVLQKLKNDPRIQWQGTPSLLELDLQNYPSAEGWFFPDTYRFTRPQGSTAMLRRGVLAMKERLAEIWAKRADGLPLRDSYELLILASIVEKETGRSEEKPRIAGVFLSRLQKGMRLQTDPSVIYGIRERFDGNLRKRDLMQDGPYNTYRRAGLPPTPIACPDEQSLLAVAHPLMDGSLYFVADGKGGHWFSKTLEEHNRNVRKYLMRRQQ